MFLDALTLDPSAPNAAERYEYIQSADPADMELRFADRLDSIIAENDVRVNQQGLPPFNVVDVDIAGGGDGHTFVVKMLLTTSSNFTDGWLYTALPLVDVFFWMASDDEGLAARQGQAIALLKESGNPVSNIVVGHAGASKGTRFMDFIAGVVALTLRRRRRRRIR